MNPGYGNSNHECHYTLQVLVSETHDGKVMINVNAVDASYDWKGSNPGMDNVKLYMNDKISDHIEKFFEQLDILLGKAEYYKKDKAVFKNLQR